MNFGNDFLFSLHCDESFVRNDDDDPGSALTRRSILRSVGNGHSLQISDQRTETLRGAPGAPGQSWCTICKLGSVQAKTDLGAMSLCEPKMR